MEMTARLMDLAAERGWPTMTATDPNHRGGTVAINVPYAKAVAIELNKRSFLVDFRPKAGIRVSPHFYNTDQEIDETIIEMERILQDGSYRKHLKAQPAVM